MCTVTYIPRKDGIILSSNRDESPHRSPKNITRLLGKYNLCYPQDTLAGGTWIAADNRGRVICVLNGAFEKHPHRPPYRMSRGVLALEYFNTTQLDQFAQRDFNGIEPFTLVIIENEALFELRWDGQKMYEKQLDPKLFYIWSSATLYDEATRARRQTWFDQWLKQNDFSLEAIQKFHRFGGEEDSHNGIVMNRNNVVRTVSITNIYKQPNRVHMYYHELIKDLRDEQSMELATVQNQILPS